MPIKLSLIHPLKRLLLVIAGAALMALNINSFVRAGELIPGGFTGLTLLIQDIALTFGGIHIPFSVVLYTLNAIPAIVCFKFVGKKFTAYSCIMVLVCGVLTDWMPTFKYTELIINAIQLHDTLLSSVFGGILNAVSIAICLKADATSGGTDFIAIFLSEKYRKDAWNIIFAGNCVILAAAAYLFSLEKALYSIIFQFVTTMTLSALYKSYQQKTLLIITSMPEEVYKLILDKTNHGATSFDGFGYYERANRVLLYSVVASDEADELIAAIRKIDEGAFINVLKTEHINGRFNRPPRD